jgi:hypothetical protein
MPAPLLLAAGGILGGIVGDLFGSSDSEEYQRQADAALMRQRELTRRQEYDYRQAQVSRGQAALGQAQLVMRELNQGVQPDVLTRPRLRV